MRKSLHPAANALTRSTWSDEAVRATIITGIVRRGDAGELIVDEKGVQFSEPVGVEMRVPMLLARSISRISLVASIPSLTGS